MKKHFFWGTLGILFFVFFGMASAQEFVVKYSHVSVPDPMAQSSSAYAAVFKAEVEKLSGGKIKVEIYPSGQLGDQRSSVEQVRKGTIHIADISSGVLASSYYEPLGIFDLPFLFSSRITARMVLDNQTPFTKKVIEDCAQKTGIRILSLGPFGFRYLTNNTRPIRSPADMQGLKIRTMEIIPHMELMKAMGATPVPIPWLELYTSLQTKVVDGQENTLQNIIMAKFYQVQKYLTVSGHVMGVGGWLINDKWYQALPDDLKVAVIEAEKIARLTYDGFGELLDSLALDQAKANGMEIYYPTPAEMKAFRDKAIPNVRAWAETKYGKNFVAEFFAAIDKANKDLTQEMAATKAKK
jgi:C4-dicarboxylate-binding protein DctP